jgi:hypothetical protein
VVTGALGLANGTLAAKGLATAITIGALLMTAAGGCAAVSRHGARGVMIRSGGRGVLPLVPAGGSAGGVAAGGLEL